MSLVKILEELQWKQLLHDERYHKDIWILCVQNRAKHMILHLNKYSGKLFEALREKDNDKLCSHVVDAFIINFSYANIFQIPIYKKYENMSNINDFNALIKSHKSIDSNITDILIDYTIAVGKMAKTIESLDHIEQHNYRSNLNEYVFNIFEILLKLSAYLDIKDIEMIIEKRLFYVESKNMNFHRFGNYSSGYL